MPERIALSWPHRSLRRLGRSGIITAGRSRNEAPALRRPMGRTWMAGQSAVSPPPAPVIDCFRDRVIGPQATNLGRKQS